MRQTSLENPARAESSSQDQMCGAFLLQDKGKSIVAGAALTARPGLHKGDIHCLCLIRASRTGWDSLLFDGEHGYEDGQSLCSLSETIV